MLGYVASCAPSVTVHSAVATTRSMSNDGQPPGFSRTNLESPGQSRVDQRRVPIEAWGADDINSLV